MENEDGIGFYIAQLESQANRFPSLPAPKRDEYATRLRALADEVSYIVVLKKPSPPAETTAKRQQEWLSSPWLGAVYLIIFLAVILGVGAAMNNAEPDEVILNPVKFFTRAFGYAWIVCVLGVGLEVVVWVVYSVNGAFKSK